MYEGMAVNGFEGTSPTTVSQLSALDKYAFPESHAMSFAYLCSPEPGSSAYHPAAFCAARSTPSRWASTRPSPRRRTRRHGVQVRRPDETQAGPPPRWAADRAGGDHAAARRDAEQKRAVGRGWDGDTARPIPEGAPDQYEMAERIEGRSADTVGGTGYARSCRRVAGTGKPITVHLEGLANAGMR